MTEYIQGYKIWNEKRCLQRKKGWLLELSSLSPCLRCSIVESEVCFDEKWKRWQWLTLSASQPPTADVPTSTTAFFKAEIETAKLFSPSFFVSSQTCSTLLHPEMSSVTFRVTLDAPVISLSRKKRCSFRFLSKEIDTSLQKTNDEPSWHNEPNSLTFKVTKRRCFTLFWKMNYTLFDNPNSTLSRLFWKRGLSDGEKCLPFFVCFPPLQKKMKKKK